MNILPTINRSLKKSSKVKTNSKSVTSLGHEKRIRLDLIKLGVSKFGLSTMESKYLPKIIHVDEKLGGVVYGHNKDGFVMLIATDRRIIFLDKKPLFVNMDEINYDVVSGVKYESGTVGLTITLHTRIKDFKIQTLNKHCAKGFVKFIEHNSLEHSTDH